MRNNVLVVGADGFLGRALSDRLARDGHEVIKSTCLDKNVTGDWIYLDLTSDISEWRLPDGVSTVFICAAVTKLEDCRARPLESTLVNVAGTAILAKAMSERGAFIVFPSTNLVFDGDAPFRKPHDPVSPRTGYGRQKSKAEELLSDLGESVSIVRLTKILGPGAPLLSGWAESLKSNRPVRPFSDMVFSPVPLPPAVEAFCRVAELRLPGVTHVSGDRDITYARAARHIAERLGADAALVQPITTAEAGLNLEHVPAHTTLDMSDTEKRTGLKPADVFETIDYAIEKHL